MKTVFRLWMMAAGVLILPVGMASAEAIATSPWQADLSFFQTKLIAMHPNPFRRIGKTRFEAEADRLNGQLASATREQAIAGIMRLVAMLGDGHTSVLPGPQLKAGFHVLPLRFYLYGDDLVIDGADRSYAKALGGKLVAINGIAAGEVIRRVRQLTPHDNEYTVNARLPAYIVVPEVLAGLGIVRSATVPVAVTVDQSGQQITILVKAVAPLQDQAAPGIATSYSADWADRVPAAAPLWLQHPHQPYWLSYLPKNRALYVQYNNSANDTADPIAKFAQQVLREIVTRQPRRVVVDLRLNQGGDGYWNRFLIRALLRSPASSEKGRFFVLISRQTFSAGNMMAIELEKYAATTFVGEPSGGAVQGFGDHDLVFLPNTRLGVMISAGFYQNDGPTDDRQTITPQLSVPMTSGDYGAGRDPVLEAALHFGPPLPKGK